ncbi:hypothetical protein C4D60_Mb06t13130 [Musa balbisiana]|uniref:Uncharacterized protein n=1 Tax=Musa balbisiana TaxID=52838 RepID=A0A4S8IMP2_MUSBA|nr:hypothetical protein C4D60_Mb06t13130 [Musa balbisiana]
MVSAWRRMRRKPQAEGRRRRERVRKMQLEAAPSSTKALWARQCAGEDASGAAEVMDIIPIVDLIHGKAKDSLSRTDQE